MAAQMPSDFVSRLQQDPVVINSAGLSLAGFALLYCCLKWNPYPGPWKSTPAFAGHQLLAFILLIYQTYLGFQHWDFTDNNPRPDVVSEDSANEGGQYLSRVVVGSLLAIVPVHAIVLRGTTDLLMHVHHIAMFLIASIGAGLLSSDNTPIASRYGPFFLGVSELSSIFLCGVTVFHPQKEQGVWYQYAHTKPWLRTANEINRYTFAVMYMILRVVYFPHVVFGHVVPDYWRKLSRPENESYKPQLWTIFVFSILFTLLQWYWGWLIGKQLIKAIQGSAAKTNVKKHS